MGEKATSDFRYIDRDGERVLQQRFEIFGAYPEVARFYGYEEWRDVPVVAPAL